MKLATARTVNAVTALDMIVPPSNVRGASFATLRTRFPKIGTPTAELPMKTVLLSNPEGSGARPVPKGTRSIAKRAQKTAMTVEEKQNRVEVFRKFFRKNNFSEIEIARHTCASKN